ncbi:MAG: Alpha-glucosidase, family, partial [Herbinix sp.]|nr:Alpha-glucosidase, family [Herbinix sp.]
MENSRSAIPGRRSKIKVIGQAVYADTSWIEPGRSAWSWLTDYGNSLGTPDAMYTYTLNAAKLGFEYNIIDEGWTKWQNYKDILASIGQYGEA